MPYDHTNSRPEAELPPQAQHHRPEWAKTKREKRREAEGRKRPRWPFAVAAVVAVAAIGAVQLQGAAAPTDAVSAAPAVAAEGASVLIHPMDTTRIARAPLQETLRVTGTLKPRVQVQVKSKASGTISEVKVRLGDRVSTGQPLLQIDDEVLRNQFEQQSASVAAQKAQLTLAKAEAERAKQLAGRGVSTAASLDTASSNLAVQRAHLSQQEALLAASEINLRDASITAPFDGIVAKRIVEPGQTLAAGDEVFELADLSQMTFDSYVPVSSTLTLAQGQGVKFAIEGLPGQDFFGKIEGISPTAASGSRNAQVSILVDNSDGRLRGGMFATGLIELNRKNDAVAVSSDAIRKDAEGAYVLKIAEGKLQRQEVETDGEWHGGKMVSIASGLQPGDEIISGKLSDLTPGTSVRVTEIE